MRLTPNILFLFCPPHSGRFLRVPPQPLGDEHPRKKSTPEHLLSENFSRTHRVKIQEEEEDEGEEQEEDEEEEEG